VNLPYGRGWDCDFGYVHEGDRCVTLELPEHAYATFSEYGRAWACERGYRVASNTCAEVKVPAHAYLTALGDGWECARGFVRRWRATLLPCAPARDTIDS
jgi:hypothetical protein